MGRVTVEKCLNKVPNHFELVLLASERAKQIAMGSIYSKDHKSPKNHVIAIREIEESELYTSADPKKLRKDLLVSSNKVANVLDTEEIIDEDIIEGILDHEFVEEEFMGSISEGTEADL